MPTNFKTVKTWANMFNNAKREVSILPLSYSLFNMLFQAKFPNLAKQGHVFLNVPAVLVLGLTRGFSIITNVDIIDSFINKPAAQAADTDPSPLKLKQ